MPAPFEILGPYSNREGDAYIVFKEDAWEMHIPCTEAYERVSFFYHHISKWYRPFDQGVVSEATRAHISSKIREHFVGLGSPTEKWGINHYSYVSEHIKYARLEGRELTFSCLCCGYLLGLFESNKITERQFRLAEVQLPGFILLKAGNGSFPETYNISLVGGSENEQAIVLIDEMDDACHITFHYRGRIIEAIASDFFEAFCSIRKQLEPEKLIPFCYGASLNVFPSGMCRDMGKGLTAYRLKIGQKGKQEDFVAIFNSGPDVIPASVENQKRYSDDWRESLRR